VKEFKTRHKLIEVVECQALATFPFPLFDLQCSAGNQRKVTKDNCTLIHCQHTDCFGPFVASFSLPVRVRGLGRPESRQAYRLSLSHTRVHTHMRAAGWETSRVEKLAAAYDFHHKVSTAMLFEFGVDLRHVLMRQLCHRFNLGQHGKKGGQRARAWMGRDQKRVQTRDGTPEYAAAAGPAGRWGQRHGLHTP
jgi:hypothetical protein